MYNYAPVLCPPSSWLHKYYSTEFSQKVKVVVGPAGWGACTRTISCNSSTKALAYWNNTIAASPGDHNDIVTYDALTGSQISVLSGHTSNIYSLAFSSDGTLLVSGSWDGTVELWDVQTGGVIKSLHGHTNRACSVSISANNAMIAVRYYNSTICLWNIITGNCHIIEEHEGDSVHNTVAFSPTNSELLLSSAYLGTVQQWGIDGHKIGPPIIGHHVVFSPDGAQFLISDTRTVTIIDTGSRETVMESSLASDACNCHFSPNGRFITATNGNIIYLWDITGPNPYLIQTLTGHTGGIASLVFASSSVLISAAYDRSIKFWQIGASLTDLVTLDPEPMPLTSALIRAVSLQAKDDLAFSIDGEGVVRTWDILTSCCKKSYKTQAKYVRSGDMRLIGDRLIIVWHDFDEVIHVWDAEKGRLQTITLACNIISHLRIIGDGSRFLGITNDFNETQNSIQAWSTWTGEPAGEEILEKSRWHYFSPLRMDDSKVLVLSRDTSPQQDGNITSSVQGWDFGVPGSTPTQFSGNPPDIPHLNFINGRPWSEDGSFRVEDRSTGKEVFQLSGHYAKPTASQFDGRYLIAGYGSGEVLILDFSNALS